MTKSGFDLDEIERRVSRASPNDRAYERPMNWDEAATLLTEIRELRAENARLKSSVNKLASAEAEYRKAHDLHGDGSPQSGRAWDLMRRAGDTARAALGEPQ